MFDDDIGHIGYGIRPSARRRGLGDRAGRWLLVDLAARPLEVFETAARYHMYHALAMILAGALASTRGAAAAGWLFQAGIVVFSGSLYALALTDVKVLGAITPLGGLAFLAGWIWLAWSAWRG